MPVIVTTLVALGTYAATVLSRRRRRPTGEAPSAAAEPSHEAGSRSSVARPTAAGATAAERSRRDAA